MRNWDIAFIENEQPLIEEAKTVLGGSGYKIHQLDLDEIAKTGPKYVAQFNPNCFVVDLNLEMSSYSGMDVVQYIADLREDGQLSRTDRIIVATSLPGYVDYKTDNGVDMDLLDHEPTANGGVDIYGYRKGKAEEGPHAGKIVNYGTGLWSVLEEIHKAERDKTKDKILLNARKIIERK